MLDPDSERLEAGLGPDSHRAHLRRYLYRVVAFVFLPPEFFLGAARLRKP
jgi:hypothetical protein